MHDIAAPPHMSSEVGDLAGTPRSRQPNVYIVDCRTGTLGRTAGREPYVVGSREGGPERGKPATGYEHLISNPE